MNNKKIAWKTEKRKISELQPASYNPRELTEKQEKDLSTSLEKFSLADPIVINQDNTIIGGHQRINILKQKYGNDGFEVDVRVPSRKLTPEEEKELNLRLNKNLGQWDFDALANFDEELLKDVGFDSKELDKIFQLDAQPEDDEIPPERASTGIVLGDLYQLGQHRLLCGDATKREDVERLMAGEKADMVFTDPPYGMNKGFKNDELQNNELMLWNEKWVEQFITKDNCIFISFHSPRLFWTILDAARNKGWMIGRYFTLYKPNDMTFPWHSWLGVSESILLFMKGKPKFNSARPDDTSFWHDTYNWSHKNLVLNETISDRQKLEHPSIKPIPICQDLIWKTSFFNEIIYDPFGGSGSTLIACEKLNRKCRMMEIDPIYCQVIIDRWEKFTGKKAIKLNGKTRQTKNKN